MAQGIERLPVQYKVIIVDSITDVVADTNDRAILSFFSRCKRLCNDGRTVILTVHSNILDDKSLIRLRALCDADLNLTVENVGRRLVKVLEVRKLHGAVLNTDNVLNFEVVPQLGMRVVRTITIKV